MTAYDDRDISYDSSMPGELYQFTGGVQANYTSDAEQQVFGGLPYEPEYIHHSKLEQSDELNKQPLDITVRITNKVAQFYIHEIPPLSVNVKVFRFMHGVSEHRLIWSGQIAKAAFNSAEDECVLSCDPIFSMLRRVGLRRNYQLLCPYSTYDQRCGLNYLSYRQNGAISALNGRNISAAVITSASSNYYTAGILEHKSHYHLIINHANNQITIPSALRGGAVGDPIAVIAGCDKRFDTCVKRFGNQLRFGGFPFIPLKNPFTGDSLA